MHCKILIQDVRKLIYNIKDVIVLIKQGSKTTFSVNNIGWIAPGRTRIPIA